ncbi:MAG TPA: NAD(P)/FAD-dependent oxidoreductase [Noviherbaspirillum sp.]|jgi:NADPH-dependent 2,4-dienoyl-CoA reductase/sulfur reductase-like enzyme|uniref:NAD(P)/FAD-dependent oxidoreductase n=1 Tax=Noviherbaspirillum sp. TaxID=1926288 RepID=UPI002DDD063A|nr:NAD(P)/FAD-dependent oxidoreductase [Noviherbaspirillum sp.]HEV2610385.1 NAD(P)/FAD-dependent oxidoreductase [Noviherbaspirillum sp.]
MKRRQFMGAIGAALSSKTVAAFAAPAKPHVVVIGAGYGGATAARYLRMWSAGAIDVTLVEPNAAFISCPVSNLVLGGSKQMADITVSYQQLARRHAIRMVRDTAQAIDPDKRIVRLAGGRPLSYDRLVLSPGVEFLWDSLPGMAQAGARDKVLHAWKAGEQTFALRRQLEAMANGDTFVMSIPPAPYRCPPGPYERACQVAHYFSRAKPKSKVILLDANEDVVSKGALFKKVWAERYKDIIEYQPSFKATDVDPKTGTVISELGDEVRGAVLNVVPPQSAGGIAVQTGLANVNRRWCEVDFLTFESTQARHIHVLGDAIQVAPLMPKSAHMANQHAKICAAAIVDMFQGKPPPQNPMLTNTCYSYVSDKDVIHVTSVHAYDAQKKTLLSVPGSGGVSAAPGELEGRYAAEWARNIWADTLS